MSIRRFTADVRAHLARDGAVVIRADTHHADGTVSVSRGGVPVRQVRLWPNAIAYFEEDGRVHAFRIDVLEHVGDEWQMRVDGHDHFRLVLGPVRTAEERAEVARWHDRQPSPYADEEMREVGGRINEHAREEAAHTRGRTQRPGPRSRTSRGGGDA